MLKNRGVPDPISIGVRLLEKNILKFFCISIFFKNKTNNSAKIKAQEANDPPITSPEKHT